MTGRKTRYPPDARLRASTKTRSVFSSARTRTTGSSRIAREPAVFAVRDVPFAEDPLRGDHRLITHPDPWISAQIRGWLHAR
jgi:hypothetical protein